MKKLLLNSSYAITSNLLSLLVSTLVILILPKLIGVEEYGYWQLYLFYTSYVGFAHLGWIDGIYLKYGGEEYERLDKQKFFSQFIAYSLFQTIIAILIFVVGNSIDVGTNKEFIFNMLSLTLLATNLRFFVIYLLQTTNLIKESVRIMILDRVLYICLLLGLIVGGIYSYKLMIVVDVIGRFISLFYGIYLCRDIIVHKLTFFKLDISEVIDNIKVGSNLMLSNVASMLVIGTVRLGIEKRWDVATFGKISLTLSISNLIMTFINAVGIVIFPMLKRTEKSELPELYVKIRTLLMPVLLGFLLLFFPLRTVLMIWLPKYADSLLYMALIFPISVFEGKMALLINTYLKAFRMERTILFVNLLSMLLSVLLTIVTTFIFPNLILATLSITFLLFFRCFLAEMLLAKSLEISVALDALIEAIIAVIFIFAAWALPSLAGFLVYLVIYIIYMWIKIGSNKSLFTRLK
ncbi:hypothetical protein U0700_01310 [Streptococcus suis]|uniref:hypothetical protein n=1 Tax=Streptococcus suis TaxID=1307 RepID=UPI002E15362F|nr:hypothetical protein U0700_01310 [Streptococcus suis]